METTYVDLDGNELPDEERTRKPPKKIFGNTELQKLALAATGRTRTGFRDNKQLVKRWL